MRAAINSKNNCRIEKMQEVYGNSGAKQVPELQRNKINQTSQEAVLYSSTSTANAAQKSRGSFGGAENHMNRQCSIA